MTSVVLPGYRDLRVVRRHGDTLVLRGSTLDGVAVLVKTHAHHLPTDVTRARLRREFDMTSAVSHPHLATARELIDQPTRAALVLDDAGGTTLADLAATGSLTLDRLLDVARSVGSALAALHLAGVVHRAVDARHVEIGDVAAGDVAADDVVTLVDLYDACRLGVTPRGVSSGEHHAPEVLGSPSSAPAEGSDQFAFARTVLVAADEARLVLPTSVARALERATDPDPAARYRSVIGLVHDLERGRTSVEPFELGQLDPQLRWRPSTVMVGRDAELRQVKELVDWSSDHGRASVIVIRGTEGSGRSMLLERVAERLAERGIMSGLGRVGPGGVDFPLRAPSEAMRQIVEQVLAAPDALVDRIGDELTTRLGDDASLALQIHPSLRHLIGDAPPTREPEPTEMLRRVERAVRSCVGAIARHARPLVIALDDLDRADPASVRSLRVLARADDVGAVVVIVTIEPDVSGQIAEILTSLERARVPVSFVDLAPLDETATASLIAAGAGVRADEVSPLGTAVHRRTGGVPELVLDDVWTMLEADRFRFDLDQGRWVWSDDALDDAPRATLDEVVRRRVDGLSELDREIAGVAALAEGAGTVGVITRVLDRDDAEVDASLERSIDAHVLVRRTGIDDREVVGCVDGAIRRALVADLAEPHRRRLEAAIGQVLLAESLDDDPSLSTISDERRFEVVRLLGAARSHLNDAERPLFVALSEAAARAAHRSTAYHDALELQLQAIEVLGDDGWRVDHDGAFRLHLHAAEHALMLGRADVVDSLMDVVAANDPSPEQRVVSLRVLGSRWWTRQDPAEGLAEARALLAELGEPFPERPTWIDVGREFVAARRALVNVDPESFLGAPSMDDPRLVAVSETMIRSVHLAYTSDPLTHVMLALRGTRLTVRHGMSDGGPYFLMAYSMLSCASRTDVARALKLAHVAMTLAERIGGGIESMVRFAHLSFVRHWGEPLAVTIDPLAAQFRRSIEARRPDYGLTGGTFMVLHSLLTGQPLHVTERLAEECVTEFERLGERAFGLRVDIVRQAVADLRDGFSEAPLDGEFFSASSWLAERPRRHELALIVHTLRALVAGVYDDQALLARSVDAARTLVRTAPGQAIVAVHHLLAGLVAADAMQQAPSRRERLEQRARLERRRRWLRSWARHGVESFGHRADLLDAALAHASGDVESATHRYERALGQAIAHQSLIDVGLIAQRAADFHRSRGHAGLVDHYAEIASDAWSAWGAGAAAGSVLERFPPRFAATGIGEAGRLAGTPRVGGPLASDGPSTFARATKLLEEELEVQEFLERLVELLLDHTGADRGFLVSHGGDGPVVEAAAERVDGRIRPVRREPSDPAQFPGLCVPALSYALRTREVVSVNEPADDRRFRSDAALRHRNPRSLLCLPVGTRSGANGLLVLESDTFSHAFEPERIEALLVLSAQAIGAVENARLTSDLGSLTDDVASLRQRAAVLSAQAETDPLTGVANRIGLAAAFRAAVRRTPPSPDEVELRSAPGSPLPERQVGVLFCDLDEFKAVNDRHGHGVGDEVLRDVADRLRRAVRAGDVVARVGGDEFVVLSVDVPDGELDTIADRAVDALRRPFTVGEGRRVTVSASIGVARAAIESLESGDDIDAVLHVADQAMYRAKRAGKNRVARS